MIIKCNAQHCGVRMNEPDLSYVGEDGRSGILYMLLFVAVLGWLCGSAVTFVLYMRRIYVCA